MTTTTKPIHEKLRTLCEQDGRTLVAIAAGAGMSKSSFHQLISGHRPNPTARTIQSVLDALGKDWRDLD